MEMCAAAQQRCWIVAERSVKQEAQLTCQHPSREVRTPRESVEVVVSYDMTLLPKNEIAKVRKKEGHEIKKAESKVL